jgi:excisionase family DNA binding protein
MATSIPQKRLLSIDELSELSGISVVTLRRYVHKGKIKALQPGGRGCKLLFQPDALEQADQPPVADHTQVSDHDRSHLSGRRPEWMAPNPNP